MADPARIKAKPVTDSSLQCLNPGKICKIRGLAYVTKVSPALAARMIDAAKSALRGYIADVYITLDQRKGTAGGKSVQ